MGILLNSRIILAFYVVSLWIGLVFAVTPAYIAYKRHTFNLPGKLNNLWSRELDLDGRRLVQTVLQCCGYYSPYIEAAADGERCYARSPLPGCKGPLLAMQRHLLAKIYTALFSIVGPHLAIIVTALLCSNHVTYRFGKGKTPKAYRVDDDVLRQVYEKNVSDVIPQVGYLS